MLADKIVKVKVDYCKPRSIRVKNALKSLLQSEVLYNREQDR